ncbi:MAG: nitroreductase family protein [Elusimicrobia bacterium]|nr:nitroreductase family protein [Candidatus Liberimonas magnetica]
MTSLNELINSRRSVRKYLDKEVEQEKMMQLIEAASVAPSACNAQPWRFVFVTQKALKDELNRVGLGGAVPNSWAKTAPVMIVACSELSLFTHKLGESVQGVNFHLIDLGIAMEHLVLKATELGLGTCYIGWFNEKPIKKLLNLPASWKVDCLITLGYPESIPDATARKPIEEISFFNKIKS